MDKNKEKLLQKVTRYQSFSFIIMSLIISYHLVTPVTIGGYILTLLLVFPIFIASHALLNRILAVK